MASKITKTIDIPSSTWIVVEWRWLDNNFQRQPFPVFFASGMGGAEDGSIEGIVEDHAVEQRSLGNDIHVAAYMLATDVDIPTDDSTCVRLSDDFYSQHPVENEDS